MIKQFLNYVEITTKITSTFAFLYTLALLFFMGQSIDIKLTLIFFGAMFIFDLTTTAINNYTDTKTNTQTLQFKRRNALAIIVVLFVISAGLGLYLAILTDVVVLLLGGLCFLCGVFYTFGPVPISRQPLGEALSGLFYGFLIPFLILYINMPKGTFFTFELTAETISLDLQFIPLIKLIIFATIPFCTTANIMLANNICDVEGDVLVKRFTLPYYLGTKTSVNLFAGLYYLTYAAIVVMVAIGMLSPICLLSLLTIVVVQKNINTFRKRQDKAVTFVTAIKNYVIIMASNTIVIFASGLLV